MVTKDAEFVWPVPIATGAADIPAWPCAPVAPVGLGLQWHP